MSPMKKKEFIIMDKDTGHVIHEGTDRRTPLSEIWNWMGLTIPDFLKMFFYCSIAIYFGTRFYIDGENTKIFISTQTEINKKIFDCMFSADKWQSAANGHEFQCGSPIDGWVPNRGSITK